MSARSEIAHDIARYGLEGYLDFVWEQRDPHGRFIHSQGAWPISRVEAQKPLPFCRKVKTAKK